MSDASLAIVFTAIYVVVTGTYDLLTPYADADPVFMVCMENVVKLCIALVIWYFHGAKRDKGASFPVEAVRVLVPSLLYLISDVLFFVNMRAWGTVLYKVLSELRILCIAVLHVALKTKCLKSHQAVGLLVVTISCIICLWNGSAFATEASPSALMSIAVQIVFASLATVASAHVIQTSKWNVATQNVCQYSYSIFFSSSSFFVFFTKSAGPYQMISKCSAVSWLVIFLGASSGLSTAYLLKHSDAIRKSIANALRLIVVTAIVSLLRTKMTANVWISVCGVIFGTMYYHGHLRARTPIILAVVCFVVAEALLFATVSNVDEKMGNEQLYSSLPSEPGTPGTIRGGGNAVSEGA